LLAEGGYLEKYLDDRVGRGCKSPPQFGQVLFRRVETQVAQNVHSNEQIIASLLVGGKSRSQHSQLNVIASIVISLLSAMLQVRRSGCERI
jgi:hypothetical protein